MQLKNVYKSSSKNITSQTKNYKQKIIRISLYIIVLVIIAILISLQTNTTLATDLSTTIKHEEITTNNKSKINFSNDDNYLYFNTELLKPTSNETLYTTATINMSKIWSEARNKEITVILEKSTNNQTYTRVTAEELSQNNTITLMEDEEQTIAKMYYRVSIELDNEKVKVSERNIDLDLNVETDIRYNFEFEEKQQEFVTPVTGEYRIELWGAAGNYFPNNMKEEVGKGAYTAGTIELEEGQELYIYTGKNSTDEGNFYTASFNAGSTAKGKDRTDKYGHNSSSGGGATDVRLVSGNWNNTASLRSRIMVAAGGGGTHYYLSTDDRVIVKGEGGAAGGLIGYRGYQMSVKYPYSFSWTFTEYDSSVHTVATLNTPYAYTGGGSQKIGGSTNTCKIASSCAENAMGQAGSLGIGGSGAVRTGGAGGGGGYYGGGGGGQSYADNRPDSGLCHSSGAGGSSYISGHTGSIAITSATNENPKAGCTETGTTPERYVGTTNNTCSVHYSGLTFTDTVMIDGEGYSWTNRRGSKQAMPSYNEEEIETGNSGSGAARITALTLGAESNLSKTSSIVITSKYVDEDGIEIGEREQILKNEGDSYTTNPKDIEGYILKATPSNASGTVGDADITVTYVYQKLYTVRYQSDNYGKITGKEAEEVIDNNNPTGTTESSNTGYHLTYWTANKDLTLEDGTKKTSGTSLTMNEIKTVVVTEDITFTAHHEINRYNIIYKSDEHGTITGITSETVNHNNSPTGTTESSNTGYHLIYWTANKDVTLEDGTKKTSGTGLTMNEIKTVVITEDLTFTAHHEINKYNITYKSDENGTITGKTEETISYENNPTGTEEVPNPGYCEAKGWVADKKVELKDGNTVEAGNIMTFEQMQNVMVKEDITFTVLHDRCYGELTILKIDEETKKVIQGVEFRLLNKDGSEAKDIYNNPIANVTTNEQGIARFINVPYGDYILEEVKTNSYYKILEEPIEITFGENEDAINIEKVNKEATSFVISNIPIDFKMLKKDIDTDKNIKGAEFEIIDENGKVFKTITIKNEIETISIPTGSYTLVETVSPDGYKTSNIEINFKVLEDGNIEITEEESNLYELEQSEEETDNDKDSLTIYNEKTEILKIPNTGSEIKIITIVGGIVLILGGSYIIYRKYKDSNFTI